MMEKYTLMDYAKDHPLPKGTAEAMVQRSEVLGGIADMLRARGESEEYIEWVLMRL